MTITGIAIIKKSVLLSLNTSVSSFLNIATIIFSSHRMEEVQSLADNIGVIYNGKIIFFGSKTDFESRMDSVSYDDTLIQMIKYA